MSQVLIAFCLNREEKYVILHKMENKKFKKGHTPWNKGMKGFKHSGSFKTGRIVSGEIRKKISEGNTGKIRTEEVKNNMKGKRNSVDTEIKKGQRIGIKTEFKKGQIPWNKRIDETKIIKSYNYGESVKNISKEFNCHFGTIYQILNKNNIILRDRDSGEESKLWLGGKSFEPYDKNFNLKFKNLIRKRDNQICMLCGIHNEKLKSALNVHHINYDKLLSIPQNCISLCKVCHVRTNFNRKQWIKFFQSLLSEKYNYQYSSNKEIIVNMLGGKICSGV